MTHIINNRNAAPAAFGSVLDQLLPKNVTTLLDDAFWGFGSNHASPVAPVNIRETAEGFDLQLAAPGLQKSDFHLKINGDTLTVSYTPQEEQRTDTAQAGSNHGQNNDSPQPRWVRREFRQQAFQRHFELADTIDRDKISARYESGILYLALPKKENLRPVSRQIDIH
jgi:HSP20 family protein